jgi:O-antigen ligase
MQMSRSFRTWLFVALIALMLLGLKEIRSVKVLALLPWFFLMSFGSEPLKQLTLDLREVAICIVLTLLLLLWIFFSQLVNGFSNAGIRQLLQFSVWIPVFLCIALLARQDTLFFNTVLIACLGVLLFYFSLMMWQKLYMGHPRPPALNHNVLIGTLCFSVFTVCACSATTKKTSRIFIVLSACLLTGCIIVSGARAPIGTITFSLILCVLFLQKHHRIRWLAGVTSVFCLLTALSWPRVEVLMNDYASLQTGQRYTSLGIRLDAWHSFVDIIKRDPLFGVSVKGVQQAFNTYLYKSPDSTAWAYTFEHLHNDGLQLAASYGIAAGVLYFLFLISAAWFLMRSAFSKFTSVEARTKIFFGSALFVNVLLASFTDSFTFWGETQIALQTAFGILLAQHLLSTQRRTPQV